MRRFVGLTFLAALAMLPPVRAGTIDYEFRDVHWPNEGIGSMSVDSAALARGYFTNADLLGFGVNLFSAASLDAFTCPISSDGAAAGDGGAITASLDAYGSTYTLFVEFDATAFDPVSGGSWYVKTAEGRGVYGYGYWSATIAAESVTEPSAVVMTAIALACGVIVARTREDHT